MNKPKPKSIICIKLRTQMIQELSESFAIIMKKILYLNQWILLNKPRNTKHVAQQLISKQINREKS